MGDFWLHFLFTLLFASFDFLLLSFVIFGVLSYVSSTAWPIVDGADRWSFRWPYVRGLLDELLTRVSNTIWWLVTVESFLLLSAVV